jgi:hypothetical protein
MLWILEARKHRRDKRTSRSKWFALTIVSHPKVAAERPSKGDGLGMHFRGSLCSHLKVTIGGSDSVSIKYALKKTTRLSRRDRRWLPATTISARCRLKRASLTGSSSQQHPPVMTVGPTVTKDWPST